MNRLKIKSLDNKVSDIRYEFEFTENKLLPYSLETSDIISSDSHTDQIVLSEDVISSSFDDGVDESQKVDYMIAAASGLLCSMIDIFWVGPFSLAEAAQSGKISINKFVLFFATKLGYSGNTLDGAIRFLEKYHMPGDSAINDFGGGGRHHLRDFTHHPTIVGLVFSIIAQFTNTVYGTDSKGIFNGIAISPEISVIGKNFPEKILLGTVNWFKHLVSDMAGSNQYPGQGTGLPGPILSLLKEASTLPVIKDLTINYRQQEEIKFSEWISKLFNGTFFYNRTTGESIRFDLRTEMGITKYVLKQAVPVIINETLVRGFFFLKRLMKEIKSKNITSLQQISQLDPQNFLPGNNRELTRMLTIATGVFTLIDIGQAFGKATIDSHGNAVVFAKQALTRINFVGVGRFVIAFTVDAKYISQDIKTMYKNYQQKVSIMNEELYQIPEMRSLSLNPNQIRLLFNLQLQMIGYDIRNTKNKDQIALKQRWLLKWLEGVIEAQKSSDKSYFFNSEMKFYAELYDELAQTSNPIWLYELFLEASHFIPYSPLSDSKKNPYAKLKLKANYLENVFCKKQEIAGNYPLKELTHSYKKNLALLTNSKSKIATGMAAAVSLSLITGGAAAVFAPTIATSLIGGSFAGLSGAALTNASLATIGGGALAAGGFGMAGGVAVIAGGGAALGLIGGGAISATSMALLSSKEQTLGWFAKLLALVSVLNSEVNQQTRLIPKVQNNLKIMKARLENELERLEEMELSESAEQRKEIKQLIKNGKISLKYLKRASVALSKMPKKRIR